MGKRAKLLHIVRAIVLSRAQTLLQPCLMAELELFSGSCKCYDHNIFTFIVHVSRMMNRLQIKQWRFRLALIPDPLSLVSSKHVNRLMSGVFPHLIQKTLQRNPKDATSWPTRTLAAIGSRQWSFHVIFLTRHSLFFFQEGTQLISDNPSISWSVFSSDKDLHFREASPQAFREGSAGEGFRGCGLGAHQVRVGISGYATSLYIFGYFWIMDLETD